MIEINGIYKLKQIKGLTNNDTSDYKVMLISKDGEFIGCERVNGYNIGERFVFAKECFIDPDKPDDIYLGEVVEEKN